MHRLSEGQERGATSRSWPKKGSKLMTFILFPPHFSSITLMFFCNCLAIFSTSRGRTLNLWWRLHAHLEFKRDTCVTRTHTVREVRQKIYRQYVRWHTLSLFIPIFCVLLFHFVTVCTVEKIWVGGCVTVTFHIFEKLILDRLETPKNDREISQTPSPTWFSILLPASIVFVWNKFHLTN